MAAVISCLSHSDSEIFAEILVKLNSFNLLTEENLGKMNAIHKLDCMSLATILTKLSLVGENETSHLLTQVNFDRLIEIAKLNLQIPVKLFQTENGSEILTQEYFDSVIKLTQLISTLPSQENILKIKENKFDVTQLAKAMSLLDQNQLLNQENFDLLLGYSKTDFENIISVLDSMHTKQILNQENFGNFLKTFLDACIVDVQNDQIDLILEKDQDHDQTSLSDKLCKLLTSLLNKIGYNFQLVFDKIIKKFNEIVRRVGEEEPVIFHCSANTPNTFFNKPVSSDANNNVSTCNLGYGNN